MWPDAPSWIYGLALLGAAAVGAVVILAVLGGIVVAGLYVLESAASLYNQASGRNARDQARLDAEAPADRH